jgi:hypothetical protein
VPASDGHTLRGGSSVPVLLERSRSTHVEEPSKMISVLGSGVFESTRGHLATWLVCFAAIC